MGKDNVITVTLQYRDRLSVGENRKRLGFSAFHWSVMIKRDLEFHRFDVTDGIVQHPETLENINPNEDWMYRHLITSTTDKIPRYLGSVTIGRLRSSSDLERIEGLFEKIKLPGKNKRPDENCVSWTVDAVRVLQSDELCEQFQIGPFKEFVLQHGDGRVADFTSTPVFVQYPDAKVHGKRTLRWLLPKLW